MTEYGADTLREKVERIRKSRPSNPGSVRPGWDLYSAALVDIQALLAAYDAQVERADGKARDKLLAMGREQAAYEKLRHIADVADALHASLAKHLTHLPRAVRDRLAPTMNVLRRAVDAARVSDPTDAGATVIPGSPEEEVVFRAGWERGREDGIEEAAALVNTSGKTDTVGAALARRILKLRDEKPESEVV